MSHWDYRNIGASATPENKKHIEKIFEYIGYAPQPDYAPDGDDFSADESDVYCCEYSTDNRYSGRIKTSFRNMEYIDLLCLLNGLFPKTNIFIHAAVGSSVNDTWENHDTFYDTDDMTCYCDDSYTSYDCGPNGNRSSKARFVLKAPKAKYVNAFLDLSIEDGNTELTTLLQDLSQKLKDGLIVYEDDPSDEREIGKEYDIEDDVQGDEFDDFFEDDEDDEDEEYEENE